MELRTLKEDIINNKEGDRGFSLEDKSLNGYFISRYIEELDWYLIVKKDTSLLFESFALKSLKIF